MIILKVIATYIAISLISIATLTTDVSASTYTVHVGFGTGVTLEHTNWQNYGGDHHDRYVCMGKAFKTKAELIQAFPMFRGLM